MRHLITILILSIAVPSMAQQFYPIPFGSPTYSSVHLSAAYTGANGILSANKLTVHNVGGAFTSICNTAMSSGKKYFEVKINSGDYANVGIATLAANITNSLGFDAYGWSYFSVLGDTSYIVHNSAEIIYGRMLHTGDVIMVALDLTNGFMYFGRNGTWLNSGVPTSGATGTGASFSGLSGTYYWAVSNFGGNPGNYTCNFQGTTIPFTYSVPAGYSGL